MIQTPLGAGVSVLHAPEHLGEGVMLLLRMPDPKDLREAEVFLSFDNVDELITALRNLSGRIPQPGVKIHVLDSQIDLAAEYRKIRDRTVVNAVMQTLRYISSWAGDDRSVSDLIALAAHVEQAHAGGDMSGWCCPVCQEIECDAGCPLAVVRGT